MIAPHEDRPFGHGIHVIASVATFGIWSPVWFFRWTMHKIDRTREAVYDVSQQLLALEAQLVALEARHESTLERAQRG